MERQINNNSSRSAQALAHLCQMTTTRMTTQVKYAKGVQMNKKKKKKVTKGGKTLKECKEYSCGPKCVV